MALRKRQSDESRIKYLFSIFYVTSRYDFFFFCDLILRLKKTMWPRSVLSPFDFTAKKQADLQVMIDEWVITLLTNEHVGSFIIPVDDDFFV